MEGGPAILGANGETKGKVRIRQAMLVAVAAWTLPLDRGLPQIPKVPPVLVRRETQRPRHLRWCSKCGW